MAVDVSCVVLSCEAHIGLLHLQALQARNAKVEQALQ